MGINVKDKLISLIEPLGFVAGETIFLQGTLGQDEAYPSSFFTFFNSETEEMYADNVVYQSIWYIELNYYSNDPTSVNTMFDTLKPILVANGFQVQGKGFDVPSDEPSHTGRGINITYIDKY